MEAFLKALRECRAEDVAGTVAYIKKLTSGTITVKCEKAEGERRLILTNVRNSNDLSLQVNQICNGLVLKYPGFEPLSIPPPTLAVLIKPAVIDTKTYDVVPIKDGSVVTLYWWDGEWKISSVNGYEINGYTWLSNSTYESVIYELLGDARLALDTNVCYNVGFSHKEFHPSILNNEMWLVSATDRTTFEDVTAAASVIVPLASKLKDAPPMDTLMRTNRNSRKTFQLTGQRNYGYILRGKFETHGRWANVIIESELLRYIRNIYYQFPTRVNFKDAAERMAYINMRTYLDTPNLNDVRALQPSIDEVHASIDAKLKPLILNIVKRLRTKSRLGSLNDARQGIKQNVLEFFIDDIFSRGDIVTMGSKDQHGVVEAYLKNIRNIDALLIYVSSG